MADSRIIVAQTDRPVRAGRFEQHSPFVDPRSIIVRQEPPALNGENNHGTHGDGP